MSPASPAPASAGMPALPRRLVRDPCPRRGGSAYDARGRRGRPQRLRPAVRGDPGRLRAADARAATGTASSWSARRPRPRGPHAVPRVDGLLASLSAGVRRRLRPHRRLAAALPRRPPPPHPRRPPRSSATPWPARSPPSPDPTKWQNLPPRSGNSSAPRWQFFDGGRKIATSDRNTATSRGQRPLDQAQRQAGAGPDRLPGVGEQVVGDRAAHDRVAPLVEVDQVRAAPRGTARGPGTSGQSTRSCAAHDATSSSSATRSRHGYDAQPRGLEAAAVGVGRDLAGERGQQRADQPDRAVGVGARAAALDQAGQLGRPAPVATVPVATASSARGQRGQPVEARPAPAGALAGQVVDDPRGQLDRAVALGRAEHHPGAERRAERRASRSPRPARWPASPRSPTSRGTRRPARAGRAARRAGGPAAGSPYAASRTTGSDPGRLSVSSVAPGSSRVPTAAYSRSPAQHQQADPGPGLGVAEQGRPALVPGDRLRLPSGSPAGWGGRTAARPPPSPGRPRTAGRRRACAPAPGRRARRARSASRSPRPAARRAARRAPRGRAAPGPSPRRRRAPGAAGSARARRPCSLAGSPSLRLTTSTGRRPRRSASSLVANGNAGAAAAAQPDPAAPGRAARRGRARGRSPYWRAVRAPATARARSRRAAPGPGGRSPRVGIGHRRRRPVVGAGRGRRGAGRGRSCHRRTPTGRRSGWRVGSGRSSEQQAEPAASRRCGTAARAGDGDQPPAAAEVGAHPDAVQRARSATGRTTTACSSRQARCRIRCRSRLVDDHDRDQVEGDRAEPEPERLVGRARTARTPATSGCRRTRRPPRRPRAPPAAPPTAARGCGAAPG